jgi:hypothetical protein
VIFIKPIIWEISPNFFSSLFERDLSKFIVSPGESRKNTKIQIQSHKNLLRLQTFSPLSQQIAQLN